MPLCEVLEEAPAVRDAGTSSPRFRNRRVRRVRKRRQAFRERERKLEKRVHVFQACARAIIHVCYRVEK